MAQFKTEYLERELKRWARPDAHHSVRVNWRHYVKPVSDAASVFELYERKYRPDQARVPAGSSEGGRWTGEGTHTRIVAGSPSPQPSATGGANDPRVLSDAIPDNYYKPGAKVAARISKARAEECEFMHRQDLFICRATQSAACYKQAYIRYTNCQNGGPVPPLNF